MNARTEPIAKRRRTAPLLDLACNNCFYTGAGARFGTAQVIVRLIATVAIAYKLGSIRRPNARFARHGAIRRNVGFFLSVIAPFAFGVWPAAGSVALQAA